MQSNNIYSKYTITEEDIEIFKILNKLKKFDTRLSDYIEELNARNIGSPMIVQHTNGSITFTLGNLIDFVSSALEACEKECDYYDSLGNLGDSTNMNIVLKGIKKVFEQLKNIANQSQGTWSENVQHVSAFNESETFYSCR